MADIHFSIPDDLAEEANEFRLLESHVLADLIREAIRRQHIDRLFAAMGQMAALGDEPMSADDIQAEIRAASKAQSAPRY